MKLKMKTLKKALIPKLSAKKGLQLGPVRIGTKSLIAGAVAVASVYTMGAASGATGFMGRMAAGGSKVGSLAKLGASKIGSVFKKTPSMGAPSAPAIGSSEISSYMPTNAGLAVGNADIPAPDNAAYTSAVQSTPQPSQAQGSGGIFDGISRFLDSIFGVKK